MHIHSPGQIRQIMEENGLHFHKGLGQNFLFDTHYLDAIIESAGLSENDTVLEIGPGLGVLTTRLAERAKEVIAVEIDRYLIPVLTQLTQEYGNVTVVHGDILKRSLSELIPEHAGQVKVVANLPYYITTPIIMKLLEEKAPLASILIMIQKEVAQRITASPGTKEYGALTVAVNYYAEPEIKFLVPAGAFLPPPKVESAVLCLHVKKNPSVTVPDEKLFFKIIKSSFGQRRKTLANALASGFPSVAKEEIKTMLASCHLAENCRGETLSIQDFARLTEIFYEKKRI